MEDTRGENRAGDEDIFLFLSVPVSFASGISLNVSEAQNW